MSASGAYALTRRRTLQALALAGGGWTGMAHAQPGARRVVALGGSITEVVYALGAQAQLVATDTTSLFPDAAQRTPKVGYLRQLAAEGLLALRPDAVVGTSDAGPPVVLEHLRSAGVRVELVHADHTWDEVRRKIETVGTVVGRPEAARALWEQADAEWARVRRQVAQARHRPRVLFILSHTGTPKVAGTGTAAHALIGFAGGVPALSGFAGYRPMTAEALARAAPDVVLCTTQGIDALGGAARLWQRPELALTPAYAQRALVALDANHLLGFGPRLPGAVREVHQRLQTLAASAQAAPGGRGAHA